MTLAALLSLIESDSPVTREASGAVLLLGGWTTFDWEYEQSHRANIPIRSWKAPDGLIPLERPDPLASFDAQAALPGMNIVSVQFYGKQPSGWSAYLLQDGCNFIGTCPIPGPEGERRARVAAWIRSREGK